LYEAATGRRPFIADTGVETMHKILHEKPTPVEDLNPEVTVTLVHMKTTGDKLDFPLFKVGGKGLFVKEIEEALARKEVDLAVHSAKDLPAVIPEGLDLIAFPEREDPRDTLVSRGQKRFGEIRGGGKVGTGSLRRQAQLLNLRPDLEVVPIRGNLDTRLKKLTALDLDAVILASAGLHRMGWEDRISEFFDPETMIPAIGQGALAIETREEDERVRKVLEPLNHLATQISVPSKAIPRGPPPTGKFPRLNPSLVRSFVTFALF
jgi:hydroxymethylbilane synthase